MSNKENEELARRLDLGSYMLGYESTIEDHELPIGMHETLVIPHTVNLDTRKIVHSMNPTQGLPIAYMSISDSVTREYIDSVDVSDLANPESILGCWGNNKSIIQNYLNWTLNTSTKFLS